MSEDETQPGRLPSAFGDTVAASGERLHADELPPGALIGDYVVEHTQYRNINATVYRATHARDGRPAAVKVLSAASSASAHLLRRFQQEAEALNRLHHRHIVEILGQGALRDGRPFIAMEWIEGRNLHDELRARGMMSPAETVALAAQIGAALAAAHAIGIVHRDLKAQNVMATPHGQWLHLTLLDFGVAKLIDSDRRRADSLTSTGMVLGTPLSMAPEQVRGEPVDLRADVYAFGVLLFQCLTGRPPFLAETITELEEMHLHAPPPNPMELAPMPSAVGEVVLRCLEKRPERRFASMDALIAALRGAVSGDAAAPSSATRLLEVLLTASIDPALDDPDDAVLDDVAATLELGRRGCLDEGLEIAVLGANVVLATVTLPGEPEAERDVRSALIGRSLALAARLQARSGRHPAVRVAVTLAVNDATGGAAPRLGADADDGSVAISDAAGAGIAGLTLEPIAGAPGLKRVVVS
jgi:serine/threonine-protein kinase